MTEKFWHYTNGRRIDQIIESGQINLATAYIEKNERPAVWLSTNPLFENTATRLTKEGEDIPFNDSRLPAIRIEVRPSDKYVTWARFKHTGKISPRMAMHVEKVGRESGANPAQWYASFRPILMKDWLSIEIWDNSTRKWIKYIKNQQS